MTTTRQGHVFYDYAGCRGLWINETHSRDNNEQPGPKLPTSFQCNFASCSEALVGRSMSADDEQKLLPKRLPETVSKDFVSQAVINYTL